MKTIFILLLLIPFSVNCGPYIDLGIGAHLTDWKTNYHGDRYLGEENPIAVARIGYSHKIFRIYWQHMSSAASSRDNGLDVLMIDVHIELNTLF